MVTHMCIYALEVGDLSAIMPFLFWSSFYMFGVLIVSIIHHMASCMTCGPIEQQLLRKNKTCGLYDLLNFNSINKL